MPKSDLYLNFFIFKWRCKSGQLFKAKGSPVRAEKHVPRQKRRRFLLSRCELPPFRPDDPFALPLIAEKKQENLERFLPALFGSGACFLARAARKRVLQPTNLAIIPQILGSGASPGQSLKN